MNKSFYNRAFTEAFGRRGNALVSAPGRTELGGNHTDHQRGRVLAAAVDLDAVAVASKNEENIIRLVSRGFNPDTVTLDNLDPRTDERDTSAALIRGVCAWFAEHGYAVGGADIYLQSDVPAGSGLSSSAAFEVALGAVMSALYNGGTVPPLALAKAGQFAENVHFGKPCGLMDQTASAVGGVSAIDFRDPSEPIVRTVALDLAAHGYALCVTPTGGSHADLTGDYAAVPSEMRAVANALGGEYLRECEEAEFYTRLAELREKLGDRAVLRAMHFFGEDKRASSMADALEQNDFETYLQHVRDSGLSSWRQLQNIYAPANPREQGVSLALALSEKLLGLQGASRVHGGGFAGTIQAYVPSDMLEHYRAGIEAVFGVGSCRVLQIRPFGAHSEVLG